MMKFEDLMQLCTETQPVTVFFSGEQISSTADALQNFMNETVLDMNVFNIEAEDDTLRVWLKEV